MQSVEALTRLAHNRPLAAVIASDAVSGIGDWLYTTALTVYIYLVTGDPRVIAVAMTGRLLPLLLLSIPAGIAADRWSPRSILITTNATSVIAMSLMTVVVLAHADMVLFIACAVANSVAGAISMPSRASLIPLVARDDEELGRANATYATLDGVAGVAGPALAGALILIGGIGGAFLVNAASFAVVVITLLRCVPATGPLLDVGVSEHARVNPGWLAIGHRIWRALALDGAISFAAGALGALTVVLAVEGLHADASFAGVIGAAGGVGAVAGGLATAHFVNRDVTGGVALGVSVSVVGLGGVSMVANPVAAVILLGAATGALVMLDSLNTTTVQRLSADGSTGRAFGLLHSLASLWLIAGSVVPTAVAVAFGVGAAFQLTTCVVVVLGAAAIFRLDLARRPQVLTQPG